MEGEMEVVSGGIRDTGIPVVEVVKTPHQQYADSLRALARWIEEHPDLKLPHGPQILNIFPGKEEVGKYAKAMGKARKEYGSTFFRLEKDFLPAVTLHAAWYREEVCERVVVGKETVVERVPATYTTQEVVRDKVEWRCGSVMEEEHQLPSASDLDTVAKEEEVRRETDVPF